MPNPISTLQEWADLYKVAIQFRNLEPWRWMYEEAVFGIKDPVNGEIGYCTIMGQRGECLALAVYRGTNGLRFLEQIQDGEIGIGDDAVVFGQDCLMASFEDRQSQAKEDVQVVKALGLKFHGATSWPLFRSYRPGYFPWFLTQDEVRFLTVALYQAGEVAVRLAQNPSLVDPEEDTATYFVRMPVAGDHGMGWIDTWMKPVPAGKAPEPSVVIDETRLAALDGTQYQRYGEWELDFSIIAMPIRENNERPFYPYALLCLDRVTGLILAAHVARLGAHLTEFPGQILNLIEQKRQLPHVIYVCRPEVKLLIQPIAQKLRIPLKITHSLPLLEHARQALRGKLGKM